MAVLAGIVALTVISFAIEGVLDPLLLRAFPQALPTQAALSANLWVRGLTFSYGMSCVAAGGYVAARVARRLPILHALILGMVQAGLTIVAMLSPDSNRVSNHEWIVIAVLSIPAALAGGAIYRSRTAQ